MAELKNTPINDTGYIQLPVGTTAQRPGSPVNSDTRFNSQFKVVETYVDGAWKYMPSIVESGLVLYLDATEPASYPGSGTTWFDLSGNNYDLTIYGSPTFNSSGYFTFANNQTTQYIMRNVFANPTAAVTYSCWFRSNFSNAIQTPFTYSVNGNNEMLFFINSATQIAPHDLSNSFGVNVPNMQNKWCNFVWTRQSSTGISVYYMDGVQVGSRVYSPGTNITTGGYLIIGQEADSAGGGFDPAQNLDGDFSSLLVYNRALSAAEIQQNFNALRGRYGI